MRSLLMLLTALLLPSCAFTSKANDIADDVKVVSGSLVKLKNDTEAKLQVLQDKQTVLLGEIEAISGPLDANGDGDVTLAEARATYSELKKSEGGRNLLSNWETYAAILATVAGIGVGKKGVGKLWVAQHKATRAVANKEKV